MKIGILGGAFNPPHLGHLILAQDVLQSLGLDKIFFIPTNISPHKKSDDASADKRLEMLRLTIADNDNFQALDLEIKRGGVSYTIDTIRKLKNKYFEDELYLIAGSDVANTFSTWKDFADIKKMVRIVVANRKDYPLKKDDSFLMVDITQIDISSSQIRKLVKNGYSVRYLVKEKVAEYIKQQNLYLSRREDD